MPRPFYRDMLQHAQVAKPNECCGLLAGLFAKNRCEKPLSPWQSGICAEGASALVTRRYPLVNSLQSRTEYEAEARGLLRASRQMREAGVELLAVYHSHPTSAPKPSRKDVERNMGLQVMHLIISLQSAKPQVRAWWLGEEDYHEAAWEITPQSCPRFSDKSRFADTNARSVEY